MTTVEKMCRQKKRYESLQAAGFFAIADGLRVYRCPHCDGWHLSSKNVKRVSPLRRR